MRKRRKENTEYTQYSLFESEIATDHCNAPVHETGILDFFSWLPNEEDPMDFFEIASSSGDPGETSDIGSSNSYSNTSSSCFNIDDNEKPRNYIIENDNIGVGSPKVRFNNNIAAIKLLLKLEKEDRAPSSEECSILSQYVGWGGLANAFDKEKWPSEYDELKNLLTESEYTSARSSVLSSFYTSPKIIRAMWNKLVDFGFKSGNVLEPCCAIGNFFGCIPPEINANLYGVELDSISSRIAKKLYPAADIRNIGFEDTHFSNGFFDVVIGNVPFGDYSIDDERYKGIGKLLIHDYFLIKSLDLCRGGGIIALITTSGTMDKKNSSVRNQLAKRASFIGAIRLPETAFKSAAGTSVVSDILFFKKKELPLEEENFIFKNVSMFAKDVLINDYFSENPEQIVGNLEVVSGPFGNRLTVRETSDYESKLRAAFSNIVSSINIIEQEDIELDEGDSIPAIDGIKNNAFAIVNGVVYRRIDSIMLRYNPRYTTDYPRIKGMCEIRDCLYKLIDAQLNNASDEEVIHLQNKLNTEYNWFVSKNGSLNRPANKRLFADDPAAGLLLSLENCDSKGNVLSLSDIFTKKVIKAEEIKTSVDTAAEGLILSISKFAEVNLEYIANITNKSIPEVIADLKGQIYKDPVLDKYLTSSEYVSGNIRKKLQIAKRAAETDSAFDENVEILEKNIPKKIPVSEIYVALGNTWLPEMKEYITQFIQEVFMTPERLIKNDIISVEYSKHTTLWAINGSNRDYDNSTIITQFGLPEKNAYEILEDSLNLKPAKVTDYDSTTGKYIVNKEKTSIVSQKQELIKEAFNNWLFNDPERRKHIEEIYNVKFNSVKLQDFSLLANCVNLIGSNPEINLRTHQKNVIARYLYCHENLGMFHEVGAGKTYSMIGACMSARRLYKSRGKDFKALFVVPNHLIGQWASEFYKLYPSANILCSTKKDFEPKNRRRFFARIALGSYDAIIIGQSQFDKISVSSERVAKYMREDIQSIQDFIEDYKNDRNSRFTIKQAESLRKKLQQRLKRLIDEDKKDNMLSFEQLFAGSIPALFIDESQYYKNLYTYTKMSNVAGIQTTDSKKSLCILYKTKYLNELKRSVEGVKICFATGTPVSNTMTELYTNMRYLIPDTLDQLGLSDFDSWASAFGEVVCSLELAPEGNSFRMRNRFSKFHNLPELMTIFRSFADIMTADQLKLPVPNVEKHTVTVEPSEFQKVVVKSYGKRAERIRNGGVDSSIDNMLKICLEGKKLALSEKLTKLIPEALPEEALPYLHTISKGKVEYCVENCMEIYKKHPDKAQIIFCDLSTPTTKNYNVYDDLKKQLMANGIPKEKIAFIHDADTDKKKIELFEKVNSATINFLIGSTSKCGAGSNCQKNLYALHRLDIPYRASDIQQQNGRIVRQGNSCDTVHIYNYVTAGTFDAYSWQIVENKLKMVTQLMSGATLRSMEDIDEQVLDVAELKAIASGNPLIKESAELNSEVTRLKLLQSNYKNNIISLTHKIEEYYPQNIMLFSEKLTLYRKDLKTANENRGDDFVMVIGNKAYDNKVKAGEELLLAATSDFSSNYKEIGSFMGFTILSAYDAANKTTIINIKNHANHYVEIGESASGMVQRIINKINNLPKEIDAFEEKIKNLNIQLEKAKIDVKLPFKDQEILDKKIARLAEVNSLLTVA